MSNTNYEYDEVNKTINTMMVTLNNVSVIDPSTLEFSEQDVNSEDSMRDSTVDMHNNVLGTIVKYKLGWNMIDPVNASQILQAIHVPTVNGKRQFWATLHNARTNQMETRLYYVGDRTVPFKQWIPDRADGKVYSQVSFNIIEAKPDSNIADESNTSITSLGDDET